MTEPICEALGAAKASFEDGVLTASTGEITRRWRWSGRGFVTCELVSSGGRHRWEISSDPGLSDWILPGRAEDEPGVLQTISVKADTDDGFTKEHLRVCADIEYRDAAVAVRFTVWVFPDAPGLRTQLLVKALPDHASDDTRFTGRIEYLPLKVTAAMGRREIGYFNDTQNRNDTATDILMEETYRYPMDGPEWYRRASILCIEDGDTGIAVVKESHKCPNQRGHDTGMFYISPERGLICMGWGLLPSEVAEDRYREAWAHWTVAWDGGDLGRETAFKRFDATRYPIDPDRDIYILANTWGSSWNRDTAQGAASEDIVKEEIDSQADLGIDFQQIDDGWQGDQYQIWRPADFRYPGGWNPLREYAAKMGVKLGLWAAATPISIGELKDTYDDGGFLQYKLDFARLPNRDAIEELMDKVREFVLYTGHKVRINWDVTENPPRYGYFFGREYGSLYLENRKPAWPHSAVYIPHTVFRDIWQLARYVNLHKIQCSVQNIDRVDPELSDAGLHNHPYCVAIALMGTPLFFQQTRFYSKEARDAIRPLLAVYKNHRERMYSGAVYPIGEKPDNRSWSAFQCVLPGAGEGYLTVFRELHNTSPRKSIKLRFLQDADITLTDLVRDEKTTVRADSNGAIEFGIDTPADYRFYLYSVDA